MSSRGQQPDALNLNILEAHQARNLGRKDLNSPISDIWRAPSLFFQYEESLETARADEEGISMGAGTMQV